VSFLGGIDGSQHGSAGLGARLTPAHEEKRRAIRSSRLGVGTLACSRCDVPIAIGTQVLSISDRLTCPFCHHDGPVRDFLSLASPTRPARVVLRVGLLVGQADH
jgi:hypothetical protein